MGGCLLLEKLYSIKIPNNLIIPKVNLGEKQMKSDLLKEAIADAKAVKETALANAKMALEEAFTPKLQSMLSHKLAEELEDDEVSEEEEIAAEVPAMEEEDEMSDAPAMEEDEEMTEEEDAEEVSEEGEEATEETYEGEDMEAPAEEEGEEYDLTGEEEEDTEEDELDLESVIAELEAALEGEDEDVVAEEETEEMTEEEGAEEVSAEEEMTEEEEDLDINEIIRTLKEMADEEEVSEEEEVTEEDETAAELEEAYRVITSLKKTINEVNLLNAKLLYTNKLFRTFDLNEGQKMKVIENFDRAASLREVKLVYATLGENLNVARKPKTVVKESLASKPMKSSAPKKAIISEGTAVADRFKKLAGLIK